MDSRLLAGAYSYPLNECILCSLLIIEKQCMFRQMYKVHWILILTDLFVKYDRGAGSTLGISKVWAVDLKSLLCLFVKQLQYPVFLLHQHFVTVLATRLTLFLCQMPQILTYIYLATLQRSEKKCIKFREFCVRFWPWDGSLNDCFWMNISV